MLQYVLLVNPLTPESYYTTLKLVLVSSRLLPRLTHQKSFLCDLKPRSIRTDLFLFLRRPGVQPTGSPTTVETEVRRRVHKVGTHSLSTLQKQK